MDIFFFSLENQIQQNQGIRWSSLEDDSVWGAATACVIYRVGAANWAVCQSRHTLINRRAASSEITEQKVGFFLGEREMKQIYGYETERWLETGLITLAARAKC